MGAGGASHADSNQPAVRSGFALRTVDFLLAVRTGAAHQAIVFQLAVRAGAARRATAFPLAVRAGDAVRAVSFQLAVGAGGAHSAHTFPLTVRAWVAVCAVSFQLAVRTRSALDAVVLFLPVRASLSCVPHRSFSINPRVMMCARTTEERRRSRLFLEKPICRYFILSSKNFRRVFQPTPTRDEPINALLLTARRVPCLSGV